MANAPKARASKAADNGANVIDTAADFAKEAMDAALAYPKFEVPEMVRSFAEQGLAQTREAYARVKSAAEEATDMLEGSMETNRKAVHDAQFKALEMAKANTDATFDLMRQMLTVTSASDAFQLQTAFARERFEAFVGYSKDMQDMMSKAGTEAGKPVKEMLDKSFGKMS